jgi:hypothetical protein
MLPAAWQLTTLAPSTAAPRLQPSVDHTVRPSLRRQAKKENAMNQQSTQPTTATNRTAEVFTAGERAAMKERADELKAAARRGRGAAKADEESADRTRQAVARRAGISKRISPYSLRYSYIADRAGSAGVGPWVDFVIVGRGAPAWAAAPLGEVRAGCGSCRWCLFRHAVDALALAPATGIFGVPSAGAGPCGVVEEQVALRASAAPQPIGFEFVEFLDEASGEGRRQRTVGPEQLCSRHTFSHTELDTGGAFGGEGVERSAVQSLAIDDRLGRVDRRSLKSAQIGEVGRVDRLVDHTRQLRGRNRDVGQDRLGEWGYGPCRSPWPAEVGQEQQRQWRCRWLSPPHG